MLRLLPILFFLILALSGKAMGQQLEWEKAYSWPGYDDLFDVMEAEPGYFITCGTRGQFRHFHGSYEVPVISLLKFNSQGDTLWKKDIGYDGNSPRICRGDSDSFYLVSDVYIGAYPEQVMLFHIGFDGIVRDSAFVGVNIAVPAKLIRAWDGSLVYTGYAASVPGSGNLTDLVVVRLNTQGQVIWQSRFSPHPYTVGNWIEETPDHRYLASGNAGSNIWAVEIDSGAGLPLRSAFFYQTPSRINFDEKNTCVQQAPGGRYIVSGNMFGSTPRHYNSYLACYSDFSPTSKVWGGETEYEISLPPHVNQDSSIVVLRTTGTQGERHLTRLGKDSSVMWDYQILSRFGSTYSPFLNSFSYQADSSAIAVGSVYYSGTGASNDFYLCRIRNVGLPYVAVPPPVVSGMRPKVLPGLAAYPTPSTGLLTVHTRNRQPLTLYDLSGKKMLEASPDLSGTTIMDTSALPPGLYLLRQGESVVKVQRE